jgi:hypothetical protein
VKLALVILLLAGAPGCNGGLDCYVGGGSLWGGLPTAFRTSDGPVLGVRAVQGGAMVTVSSDCPPGGIAYKLDPGICAAEAGDGACVSCLKGSCCAESIDWFNGSNGASVVACVDSHCPSACPRR